MAHSRRSELAAYPWTLAIGTAVGLSAGLLWSLRSRRAGRLGELAGASVERAERQVQEVLRNDPVLGERPIQATALGNGIVELTGAVSDDDEVHRAAMLAQQTPGVRTVLNRLDNEMLESHLDENRRDLAAGRAALEETRWYGQRVGTGMRRQADTTDPDQPDDKVAILSDELGTDRALEQTSERIDKLAPGVSGHTSVPAAPSDRGNVDRASHPRLGNVPDEAIQDTRPETGIHENVHKGTELTLEESGLDEELEARGLEHRT